MVSASKERETLFIKQGRQFDDLQELFQLQEQFNHALGLHDDPQELLERSYNPVTDRWHVERLRRSGDTQGLFAFQKEFRKNMETNLMERLHATESYGEYSIQNGNIFSKEFPEKPFGEIIRRGTEYRARLGSCEKEREGDLGEISGWNYIDTVMTDPNAPLGTTILLFSPPGLVENTEYTGRFVDKFILAEGQQGRHIKRLQTAVDWTYTDYKRFAQELNPVFFDDYDGRPLDAWYLSHPIKTDKNIFDKSKDGISPSDFQRIFNHPSLERLIRQYEKDLYEEKIDWYNLSLDFNAILNLGDDLKRRFLGTILDENRVQNLQRGLYAYNIDDISIMSDKVFYTTTQTLGTRPVQAVGGGGCPTNKGIDLKGSSSGNNFGLLLNSVAKFGLENSFGMCQECQRNTSDNHYHCPECKKGYADETDKSQEERTRQCGCGFQFGC